MKKNTMKKVPAEVLAELRALRNELTIQQGETIAHQRRYEAAQADFGVAVRRAILAAGGGPDDEVDVETGEVRKPPAAKAS